MNDPSPSAQAGARSGTYRFAATVLRGPVRAMARTHWIGTDHLPRSGGCIVTANHVSYLDPLYLALFLDELGFAPRFLGKAELFDVPGIGRILAGSGQIPVHRGTGVAGHAYHDAVAAVEAGECVVIFPEGTLTRDRSLWPMVGRTGAARIARATGAPVVPVAIWGTQDMLPPYSKRLRLVPRRTVRIQAGPPMHFSSADGPDTAAVLAGSTEAMQASITDLLAGLRDQTPPVTRCDPRRRTGGVPRQAESGTSTIEREEGELA